jgi:hypothetical protein
MSALQPLIKEAIQRDKLQVAITEEFPGCYEWPTEGDIYKLKQAHFISSDKCKFKKWHYVFTTDICTLWFKRNTIRATISHGWGHGCTDEKSQAKGEFHYLHSFINENITDIHFHNSIADFHFLAPFLKNRRPRAHFISGRPKVETLMNEEYYCPKTKLASLDLIPERPTIVISSHFNPKSLFNTFDISIIEKIISENKNCNIIALGHSILWNDRNELYKRISSLDEIHSNFRFLPNLIDNTPILKCADIFVGDTSSIFFEFCMIDKPILSYKHPKFKFESDDISRVFDQSTLSFSGLEDIQALIDKTIDEPLLQKKERAVVIDQFIPKIGNSSKYILDVIEQIGKVKNNNDKKWNDILSLSQKSISEDLNKR